MLAEVDVLATDTGIELIYGLRGGDGFKGSAGSIHGLRRSDSLP